jgi:hypothetical protein
MIRVELLSKTGHLLMGEWPQEYVAAVRQFLSVPVSSPGRNANPSVVK